VFFDVVASTFIFTRPPGGGIRFDPDTDLPTVFDSLGADSDIFSSARNLLTKQWVESEKTLWRPSGLRL
jgi:hypothetical protein